MEDWHIERGESITFLRFHIIHLYFHQANVPKTLQTEPQSSDWFARNGQSLSTSRGRTDKTIALI